jgi:hypothetical protein
MGNFFLKMFTIIVCCSVPVFAEDHPENFPQEFEMTSYGSFVNFRGVPNALFFFEEIANEDSFEFRKALRNHEIDTVVLWSNGGSVFEGLQMAGIIHDRGLATYVPEFGECYSACSFMFFGGDTKISKGLLGVHQFSADEQASKETEQIGKTQEISQFTVSEIVGFLNEFKTPPWVFEKMFQQQEMYVFSKQELSRLETRSSNYDLKKLDEIDSFLTRLSDFMAEEACNEDLKECSAEQLCERSIKEDNWSADIVAQPFVREAKRRGLSCNVTEVNTTCISDASKCSDEQLCGEVTMRKNGVTLWREDAAVEKYLIETKKRGLMCGVSEQIPSAAKLSIYTEKNDFKVGENLILEITSTEKCKLTLINVDDDKDSCVLYPNEKFGDKALLAGQSFKFPPAGKLRFSEAGTETIIAICNYSSDAIDAQLRDTNPVSCYKSLDENYRLGTADDTILETLILDYTDDEISSIDDIPDASEVSNLTGDTVKATVHFKVKE